MSESTDWLTDLFEPVGPVTVRRMFGGAGIYRDGVMFALTDGDQIFLKSDESTREKFREAGCRCFVYEKDGKAVEMSYWSLPDAALDDAEMLKVWADLAYQTALRAKRPERRGKG